MKENCLRRPPYVKKRVYQDSLAWNPDVVLLMLGSNDTKKRNWDPEIFRRDYKQIVQSCFSFYSYKSRICGLIYIFSVDGNTFCEYGKRVVVLHIEYE